MKICERKKLRLPRVRIATTENFPILIRRRRASCTIFNVKGIIIIISISHTPSFNFPSCTYRVQNFYHFTYSKSTSRRPHISLLLRVYTYIQQMYVHLENIQFVLRILVQHMYDVVVVRNGTERSFSFHCSGKFKEFLKGKR